jgi:hypothetical protein
MNTYLSSPILFLSVISSYMSVKGSAALFSSVLKQRVKLLYLSENDGGIFKEIQSYEGWLMKSISQIADLFFSQ